MSSGGSKHAQAEAFRKQMANRSKAASADFSKHVQPALEKVEFVANKIPALKQLEEATGVKKEYLLIIFVVTVRLAPPHKRRDFRRQMCVHYFFE